MSSSSDTLIIDHLAQYVSDHKRRTIEEVLDKRTRHLTIVLEDIFQSQNASAVFRTAECFGVQDIHLIENMSKYALNKRVLRGANKWLTIKKHAQKEKDNSRACLESLKASGYKILATMPSANLTIQQVDVSNKIAVVMGNELHGLSDTAIALADYKVTIPMFGFTESLNLSVSAAICVHELINRMKASSVDWHLSEEMKKQLRLEWYRKLVRNAEMIERKFLESIA
ncbi:MAG TPA: RNA methyltransferase [Cyclobacteriaceae bacterium]|nr:RNA methyltransferase [Cyclobacteriaceae bacterium]